MNTIEDYNCNLLIAKEYPALDKNTPTVIDIEDNEKDGFVGIGLTQNGKDIFYYTSLDWVDEILKTAPLIGHNIKYDLHQLRKWGIDVKSSQIYGDTMVLAHIFDSTDIALKSCASRYLQMEWTEYKALVGKGKNKKTLDKHEIGTVANYCGCDVLATYLLNTYFLGKLNEQEKDYYRTDIILQQMTFNMESKGILLDREYLEKLKVEYQGLITEKIKYFDDNKINPNSPKQLLPFLQQHVDSNLETTNEKALLKYKKNEIVKKLLDYRATKKLLSTYIEALLEEAQNGRIHGEFKITGTVTGRFSSANPNLQNIPRGPVIRSAFLPEREKVWYKLDYSQLELRMLAHLSQDEALLKAFNDGLDLHTYTASKIFKVPMDQVTEDQRHKGKTINFSIGYGTTEFGLADQLNCSTDEAKTWIAEWWFTYLGAAAYKTRVIWNARHTGYITTLFGIKRPIKDIEHWCGCGQRHCKQCWRDKAMSRELMSAQVSGSSADVVRKAMAEVGKAGYLPLVQVHDELDFSMPENCTQISDIRNIMENVVKLSVPLVVDIKTGKNWGECK